MAMDEHGEPAAPSDPRRRIRATQEDLAGAGDEPR
jgi:hypothetical protein